MTVKKKSAAEERGSANFHLMPDGSISTPRVERFALFLADDVPEPQAWKLTGGRDNGGSFQYRKTVIKHPVFVQRLEALRKEKEELMADELFGEPKWMVAQMWREARAKGDATLMSKALDARMKILEKEEARRPPAEAPQEGVQTGGRVGKPVRENPQTINQMDDLKAKLKAKGIAPPGEAKVETAPGVEPEIAFPVVEIARSPIDEIVSVGDDDFMSRLERAVPAAA